jgi:hypothetical protein
MHQFRMRQRNEVLVAREMMMQSRAIDTGMQDTRRQIGFVGTEDFGMRQGYQV